MPGWVTVATCSSRPEAELARSLLEQSGIACILQSDDLGGLGPHLGFASGVRVMVDERDAEEARALLAPPDSGEVPSTE